MRRIRLCLILAAIAAVYFCRLGHPLLWADEADTGIFARNVLRSGYPTAFDGRNVSLADDGAQLNRTLLSKKIPWVQYYVGALSLAACGDDTAGLRALFALAGLLAFFPLQAPQVVLFQRSARYYSLLILLYSVLVWHLSARFKSGRVRWGVAALVFVLFFHTHPFAAFCAAFSLLLFCLGLRREAFPGYLAAAAAGLLSWLAWDALLGPALVSTPLTLGLVTSHFALWWRGFSLGVGAAAVDLDAVGCFPLLLWAAALGWLGWRNRPALRQLARDPVLIFVLLNLAVQAVATAAVFGPETGAYFAILRYMPHLLVFAIVAGCVVLNSAVRSAAAYGLVCLLGVATNFLTLSHWAAPLGRKVPASWAVPVYAEIVHPQKNPWEGAVARLRTEASASTRRDQVILAWPPWTKESMIFYLGDLALIRQTSLAAVPAETNRLIGEALGAEASRRLGAEPEWLVDLVGVFRTTPSGYVLDATFPAYQADPDRGTRPELTRHAFAEAEPTGGGIRIFRRE
jgi:hypothetical protein